jgi:hypothetical protein
MRMPHFLTTARLIVPLRCETPGVFALGAADYAYGYG